MPNYPRSSNSFQRIAMRDNVELILEEEPFLNKSSGRATTGLLFSKIVPTMSKYVTGAKEILISYAIWPIT